MASSSVTTISNSGAHAPAKCRGAIVTGADYRGLGVVRSLGRRGIPVWVVTDEHTVAATSRYATRRIAGPAPEQKEFGDFLLDLGRRHDLSGWTIFPTGDTAAAVVSQQFQKLAEAYFLTVPPWEVMRWAYDKRFTHQLANRVGVDHPRTHYPSNRED